MREMKSRQEMDQTYCDDLAGEYDDVIYNVRENDIGGLVAGHIARMGDSRHIAAISVVAWANLRASSPRISAVYTLATSRPSCWQKPGGHLLLVTPATESMQYTQFRRIDWCLRTGMDCASAIRASVPARGSVRDLDPGIRAIEGVRTKHHLREELIVLLRGHQLEVLSVEKLIYPWTMEFPDPPAWLQGPQPWDWLVLARRT